MSETSLPTQFAPAERAPSETIQRQIAALEDRPQFAHVVSAIPNVLVVLNEQRQVVYANERLIEMLDLPDWKQISAKRPGEVLECVHSDETEGGCGTTEFCSECGAVQAILESQKGSACVQECRILTREGTALDLRVWAAPYDQDGELFTIFAVTDISDEKRREVLERAFFHDALNSAGCLEGLSGLLQEEEIPDTAGELVSAIAGSSRRLVEEIQSHRQLIAAERGDLELRETEVASRMLLQEIAQAYAAHEVAEDRTILVSEDAASAFFVTDPMLLRRVIGNMVKNALEATPPGGTVTLTCTQNGDIRFSVHNQAVMPRDVQLQVFQRSFSTKGAGRGVGTYSMKLLGEKYLGGEVQFTSSEEEGTTFSVTLPRRTEV